MLLRLARASLVALVLVVRVASADAPLRTDNADVPDAGNCKLESGYEGTRSSPGFFIGGSCVPLGFVELGVGYDRSRGDDRTWTNGYAFQAKVPIVPKDDDDDWYALAASASVGRNSGDPGGGVQWAWLNVPWSFYLMSDRFRVHLNAGSLWQRDRATLFTWGAATEYEARNVVWLAEVYRIEAGRARFNVGLRWEPSDGFAAYVSTGRSLGSNVDGWQVTAGIKLESATALKALSETSAAAGRALATQARSTPAP